MYRQFFEETRNGSRLHSCLPRPSRQDAYFTLRQSFKNSTSSVSEPNLPKISRGRIGPLRRRHEALSGMFHRRRPRPKVGEKTFVPTESREEPRNGTEAIDSRVVCVGELGEVNARKTTPWICAPRTSRLRGCGMLCMAFAALFPLPRDADWPTLDCLSPGNLQRVPATPPGSVQACQALHSDSFSTRAPMRLSAAKEISLNLPVAGSLPV